MFKGQNMLCTEKKTLFFKIVIILSKHKPIYGLLLLTGACNIIC